MYSRDTSLMRVERSETSVKLCLLVSGDHTTPSSGAVCHLIKPRQMTL